jgi:hypothetical protein
MSALNLPDESNVNPFYPGNQEPLLPSPLIKLPIGAIEPLGWLRTQLMLDRSGMVGHLPEISPFLERKGHAWLSATGEGHGHWEELPYWLKGVGDLGYVLEDRRLIEVARIWIEGILDSQQPDGWIGPRRNREANDIWPNMVAMDCLRSFHEATGDERALECLTRYLRWQHAQPASRLLPESWQKIRGGDNLDSIYWLYNRTGEGFLLELAETVHARTADWTSGLPSPHGVNICQGFREPAQFYVQSRDPAHLQATIDNHARVMSRYGQVPGGMFGADENCREGHHDPRQGAETCSMVEFLRSFEMLLRVTGDPIWADRVEDIAFNSLPAAMTRDHAALHYLTAPNQVQLDGRNKSPGVENRGAMFAYSAYRYRCCQHNVGQGWPYLAEELWHATPDCGLAASLLARCSVVARVGNGATVRIEEETDYPFDGYVRFAVTAPRPVRFPLHVRVPGWSEDARFTVNDRAVDAGCAPREYARIEREWHDGDTVELELPMRLEVKVWEQNGRSVSVVRGPLAYSLRIGERWERFEGNETWPAHEKADGPSTPKWPAWEVYPSTAWNYALALDPDRAESAPAGFEVVERPGPLADQPFALEAAPIEIRAPARRLESWGQDEQGLVDPVPPSPVETSAPLETVTLVPMGCARIRISAFPVCRP